MTPVRATSSHPRATNLSPGVVVYREDVEWVDIVDYHGQPQDSGACQALIDPTVVGPDGGALTAIGIYRMEPHSEHPLHLHVQATEVYFVVAGRARFTVGDDVFEGRPGMTIHLPAGLPHAVATDDEPLEVLYVFAPGDMTKLGTTFIDAAHDTTQEA